ncbi:hypothetical protein [Fibrella arboris]|uniref:hypothetical protein n=1 Tax=Fibrella arboris TaxID=3242486 RepID=UPI00351FA28A
MAHNSTLAVFDTFNKKLVSYLIVGGTAVSFYGQYRRSITSSGEVVDKPDIDIWYNPTYTNYYNLLNALRALGQDVIRYQEETTPDPKSAFFKYELDDYTLDLIPRLHAPLKFSDCFSRRTIATAARIELPFISLADLLTDKRSLGRAKDLSDIENLRRNNPDSLGL